MDRSGIPAKKAKTVSSTATSSQSVEESDLPKTSMEVTADDVVDTNTLKIKRLNLKMDFDHNYTLPNDIKKIKEKYLQRPCSRKN